MGGERGGVEEGEGGEEEEGGDDEGKEREESEDEEVEPRGGRDEDRRRGQHWGDDDTDGTSGDERRRTKPPIFGRQMVAGDAGIPVIPDPVGLRRSAEKILVEVFGQEELCFATRGGSRLDLYSSSKRPERLCSNERPNGDG